MASVSLFVTLNDSALTGKVLADFTVDFCKDMAGANVSQLGMSLLELGAGDYVLTNPNITSRTSLRMHLTADSGIVVLAVFDPADGMLRSFAAGTVSEPFSFGDDTVTGKVFGDLTVDYCKTLSGVNVSQSGMGLVELGSGVYVLTNPNITALAACRVHLTADSTKRAAVLFDPFDGTTAAATDPLRQRIMAAVLSRMQTVLTTNGYKTNIGSNVYIYKQGLFLPTELPGMDIRDRHDVSADTVGDDNNVLGLEILIAEDGDVSPDTLREIEADIITAVALDRTWGGLAEDTLSLRIGPAQVEIADRTVSGARAECTIEYVTEVMNAYQ